MIRSSDLINATSCGGRFRVVVKGDQVFRVCLLCEAEFEQTDEGLSALKAHEFQHGIGTLFNWSEVDGKTLRLVVVPYDTEQSLHSCEADLYAVDDASGVVYHLNHEYGHSWQTEVGGWKWKIGKAMPRVDGRPLMPHDQALRLIGCGSTDEK